MELIKSQFAVEASDFEALVLWRENHTRVQSWEQICQGNMVTVGRIADRPVCVQLNWNIINGKRVLFYSASSQLVDWVMIEKWLKANALTEGHTMTDAQNFHNILSQL